MNTKGSQKVIQARIDFYKKQQMTLAALATVSFLLLLCAISLLVMTLFYVNNNAMSHDEFYVNYQKGNYECDLLVIDCQ